MTAVGEAIDKRMAEIEEQGRVLHAESDLGALFQVGLVLADLDDLMNVDFADDDEARRRYYERMSAALHSVADRIASHVGEAAGGPAIDWNRSPRLNPHKRQCN
jgi:hypothetical protein